MSGRVRRSRCVWLAALVATTIPLIGQAQGLKPLWQSKEFVNPVSVAYDAKKRELYVADMNGAPGVVDVKGDIAKLDLKGKLTDAHWRARLNAPKSLLVHDRELYATDINRVLKLDLDSRNAEAFLAPGAKYFGPVAIAPDGALYVADTAASSIWRLNANELQPWFTPPADQFCQPGGMLAESDGLVVACWLKNDAAGKPGPGPVYKVKYADKSSAVLGDGAPIGNLFGIQPDGAGGYLLSDWGKGALLSFKPGRKSETLARLGAGLADFKLVPEHDLLIAPSAEDHLVRAYSLKALLKR